MDAAGARPDAEPAPAPGTGSPGGGAAVSQPADEGALLAALRAGDERAFVALVEAHHGSLLRLAQAYVPNRAVAEEVVQETWQGVIAGLHRFEGRASLKAWIFRILTNCAKTRGARESRTVPFSSLSGVEGASGEPAVEPDRFRTTEPSPGHWISLPNDWGSVPEARLLARETRERVRQAIATLPPMQRQVIILRDVEQCTAEEVCSLLEISEGNQRVLLHRARSKVRRLLEEYLDPAAGGPPG